MTEKRWPTVQEILDRTREGIIDETTALVRPAPEDLAAMRQELEQLRASRAAQPEAQRPKRRKRPA